MTYAEYLKSQGATDDEIKVLDVAAGRKAFDKMQADLAESNRQREISAKDVENYKAWYNDKAVPEMKAMQDREVAARAEAAKAREAILALRDQGLEELAKSMGYELPNANANPANANPNPAAAAPSFNEQDFINRVILPIAEKEGDAIALAQDIAYEHHVLFPDRPLNFRELRRQAVAARKPVEQLWMETYNVAAAREARAAADKKAAEDAVRADERKKVEAELVSKFSNPDTRPLSTSHFPTTARPERGREKQPWEVPDRSAERVANITTKLLQGQIAGAPKN